MNVAFRLEKVPFVSRMSVVIGQMRKRGVYSMTKRMNEKRAIEILKKARDYYSMKRSGYDAVIKWLEGRVKRKGQQTPEDI